MADQISEKQVQQVARLSRLRLRDDQTHRFAGQLSAVLDYMSKLNELDVADVEPMAHTMDATNVLRDDQSNAGITIDAALGNAPDKSPPFFKVPKVLGENTGA